VRTDLSQQPKERLARLGSQRLQPSKVRWRQIFKFACEPKRSFDLR